MTTTITPYLTFPGGDARAAMEHYHQALGGSLDLVTFAEGGMPVDDTNPDLIMHGFLRTEAGWELMASDSGPWESITQGQAQVALALSGDDEATLRAAWDALAAGEGAEVQMPLEEAPWGGIFGQLTDAFGIRWMVNIGGEDSAQAAASDEPAAG